MSLILTQPVNKQTCSVRRMGGFSMIELMVALVIVIVLAKLAIPQFTTAKETQSAIAEINNLKNDINFARSEAIKEGEFVSLCISSNGTGCAGTAWNNGWIVYSNPTGGAGFGAGSVLLRAQPAFTSTDTVVTNPSPTSNVTFNRDGFAVGLTSGTGLLFQIDNVSSNYAATRCLWLNLIGPPLVQTYKQAASSAAQGTNTCLLA